MTSYEVLSLIISLGGFTTVIVTLVFLTRQTREATTQTKYLAESLKSSAYASVADQMLRVDEVFIRYPELRPYFYLGKFISENDAQYNRAVAMAELILDLHYSVLVQSDHFPQAWPHQWWKVYVVDSFASSPILCEHLNALKNWYTDEMIALMREGEAQRLQKSARGEKQEVA
ncbi:MAG: hypothetical protein NTZ04_02980 [Chloroflexi bacterium]|nr:hypothetical protein [Chloroflexota bacterium]